jgi:hypothetical protein
MESVAAISRGPETVAALDTADATDRETHMDMDMGMERERAAEGRNPATERSRAGSGTLGRELRNHAPFTALGSLGGLLFAFFLLRGGASPGLSRSLFEVAHPFHVFLSAVATTNLYARQRRGSIAATVVVGYVGAIGIATLSDSLVPYLGEWLLQLPARAAHLGFLENVWRVQAAAIMGIALGMTLPRTALPHAGHVLLSTAGSLFHMTMALESPPTLATWTILGVFLFLAVWLPCCTSDILFPMLCPAPRRAIPLSPAQESRHPLAASRRDPQRRPWRLHPQEEKDRDQ